MKMNNSGIHPAGERILIKPEEVEKTSEGGIILIDEYTDKQGMAQVFGTLVAAGVDAWTDYEKPFAAVGDRVLFAKYGGLQVVGKDGVSYRLTNDTDITAKIDADVQNPDLAPRQSISSQKEVA